MDGFPKIRFSNSVDSVDSFLLKKTSIKIDSCVDGFAYGQPQVSFYIQCSTNFSKHCDHLANAGKFWTSELSLGKIGNLNSGSKLLVGFIMGISFQWQSITIRAMACSYESEVYIIQFSNRMDLNSYQSPMQKQPQSLSLAATRSHRLWQWLWYIIIVFHHGRGKCRWCR